LPPEAAGLIALMDVAEKIARFERRMKQLDRIIGLFRFLRRLTGYASERVHEIRALSETAAQAGKEELIVTLSGQHRAKIKEMQERADPIFRRNELMVKKLEELFAEPHRLLRDLENDRADSAIDRLLQSTENSLLSYQSLLASHIFDLDEFANELKEIAEKPS
jgi:hypothetical protein